MAPATVLSTAPLVFAAVAPGGVHAMLATEGGDLSDVGDGRAFVFDALAGRRFDVLLETDSAALQSTLEVAGASGTTLVTADVAGESLLLSGLVADGGPITVTAAAFEGVGAFTARVLVDGVFEREIATGSPNGDIATAQPIDESALVLPGPDADRLFVQAVSDDGGDVFAFDLAAGANVSIALGQSDPAAPGDLRIELLGPDGTVLARGIDGLRAGTLAPAPAGTDRFIEDFVATAGGRYHVRVIGDAGIEYGLAVVRGVGLVPAGDLVELTGPEGLLGTLRERASDTFYLSAGFSGSPEIAAYALVDGVVDTTAPLALRVEVAGYLLNFDEFGFPIYEDFSYDTGAYAAEAHLVVDEVAFDYTITVSRDAGAAGGEYVLVVGGVQAQDSPPVVVVRSPENSQRFLVPPTDLTLRFSEALLATSVSAADLVVTGATVVGDPVFVDGRTVRFGIAVDEAATRVSYRIGAGTVEDLQGASNQFSEGGTFDLDRIGPQVTSTDTSIRTTGFLSRALFAFDEPIDGASVTQDSIVSFTGPGGVDLLSELRAGSGGAQPALRANTSSVELTFAEQSAPGTYEIVFGRGIRDSVGRPIDQDRDGNGGEPVDDLYTLRVEVEGTSSPPDLRAGSVSVSYNDLSGAPVVRFGPQWTAFSWSYSALNGGAGRTDAADRWTDRAYLSTDPEISADDIVLGTFAGVPSGSGGPSSLPVGQTYFRSGSVSASAHTIPAGEYFVIVQLDEAATLEESDETNNIVLSWPFYIDYDAAPDLVVTDIVAPEVAAVGDTIAVRWTLANQGSDRVEGYVFFDLAASGDAVIGADTAIGSLYEFIALDPGEAVSLGRSVRLPAGGTGPYRIVVTADSGQNVFEGMGERNNATLDDRAVTIANPNLQVTDLTAPATGTVLDAITVGWTVRNTGTGATGAAAWVDRVWLSPTAELGAGAVLLGEVANPSGLDDHPPADSYVSTLTAPIPFGVRGGDYRIIVETDGAGVVGETDETDNLVIGDIIQVLPPVVPNLRVHGVTTSVVETLSGRAVDFTWTVENVGRGDFSGRFTDKLELVGTETVLLGNFVFEGTLSGGGGVVTRTQSIVLPAVLAGAFQVAVTTDSADVVDEYLDEDDNRTLGDKALDVILQPFPDLVVTEVSAPERVFAGGDFTVSWTVRNQGNGATSVPLWYDAVYLSVDDVVDESDVLLGAVANPSFLGTDATNNGYVNRLTVRTSPRLSGDYRVLVAVDDGNRVFENAGEANHLPPSAPSISVLAGPHPDLRVTDVRAPSQAFSGQPMALSWTVVNDGNAAVSLQTIHDRIVLSRNELLGDADDREMASVSAANFAPRAGGLSHDTDLAPGEVYTGQMEIRLPVGEAGAFHVFVITDERDAAFEQAGETNNVARTATPTDVRLTPPPDLELIALDVPRSVRAGETIDVRYGAANLGSTGTPESYWTDEFWLSEDTVLDASDVRVGSAVRVGALGAGQDYEAVVRLTIPHEVAGPRYLLGHVDSGNAVFELDNANNAAPNEFLLAADLLTEVVSLPANLVVRDLSAPAVAESGQPVSIGWTVANIGVGDTIADTWFDTVVLSGDDIVGNADDVRLGTFRRTGVLAAGGSFSRTESVTVPFDRVGAHHLFVVTDAPVDGAGGRVYEAAAEVDNASVAHPVALSRGTPNLVVDGVTVPEATTNGQTIPITWRVTNAGSATTNASFWYDRIHLSADAVLDEGDVVLASVRRTNPLTAGSAYDARLDFRVPSPYTAGDYFVFVTTDADNAVLEDGLESDNVAVSAPLMITFDPAVPPDVPIADLRLDLVDVPDRIASGQEIRIDYRVSNQGDAIAGRSWFDSFYLSRDRIFDRADDVLLGYGYVAPVLGHGASYENALRFRVPTGLSGSYWVIGVADAGNSLKAEPDEADNIGFDPVPLVVEIPPPGDLAVVTVTAPPSNASGTLTGVEYELQNAGAGTVSGSWVDALYLSTDAAWDPSDRFVGNFARSATLDPLAVLELAQTGFAASGLLPGEYHVIVRTDVGNAIPETREDNNAGVSLGTVRLDLPALDLTGTATARLGGPQYYKLVLEAPDAIDFNLALRDASAPVGDTVLTRSIELYVRRGDLPTRTEFDFADRAGFSSERRVIVPDAQAGTYYVLVQPGDVRVTATQTTTSSGGGSGTTVEPPGGGVPVTPSDPRTVLSARSIPFSVRGVAADTVGNDGAATLAVDGARFDADTWFELVDASGLVLSAFDVMVESGSRAYVTFDLTGLTVGAYTLRALDKDGDPASGSMVLTIVEGEGAQIDVAFNGPDRVRPDRLNLVTLSYANVGDNDLEAPLLIVRSQSGVSFGTRADALGTTDRFFLGAPGDGPADILRPESRHAIPLVYRSPGAGGQVGLRAYSVTADDATVIEDWAAIEAAVRPAGVDDARWLPYWTYTRAQLGDTWGRLVRVLNELMLDVSAGGQPVRDVREVFARLLNAAPARMSVVTFEGRLLNAADATPVADFDLAAILQTADGSATVGRTTTDAEGRYSMVLLGPAPLDLVLGNRAFLQTDGTVFFKETHVFDMDRNGIPDETVPRVATDGSVDTLTALLYVMPVPTPVVESPPPAFDAAPAITSDVAGRLHMVWMREGQIWHAVNDGAGWAHATAIPRAYALSATISAHERLIDGTSPGLLATWQKGDGDNSEIFRSVGRQRPDGSYEWSAPLRVTENSVYDGDQAVSINPDGTVLVVVQRQDQASSDDADLYGKVLAVASAVFEPGGTGGTTSSVAATNDVALTTSAGQTVRYRAGWDSQKLARLVGRTDITVQGRVAFEGRLSCNPLLTGSGALVFKDGQNERELAIAGDLRLRVDRLGGGVGRWEVETGRIKAQATWAHSVKIASFEAIGELLPAPLSIPVGMLFTLVNRVTDALNGDRLEEARYTNKLELRYEASVNGGLAWNAATGGRLPPWEFFGSFRISAGLNGQVTVPWTFVMPWDAEKVTVRALSNFTFPFQGSTIVEPSFTFLVRLEKTVGIEKQVVFRDFTYTWTPNGITLDAPMPLGAADADAQTGALEVPQTISFGPRAPEGTFVSHADPGDVTLTADRDFDGRPVIADGPGGERLLAWASERGIVVREWDAAIAQWGTERLVPETAGYDNRALAVAFDGTGEPLIVWNRLDARALAADASQEVLRQILDGGGKIVHATRDAATGEWSAPSGLGAVAEAASSVSLQRAASGEVLAVWKTIAGIEGSALRSAVWNAREGTWGAIETLDSGWFAGTVAMANDASGVVAVWSTLGDTVRGGSVLMSRHWGGEAWGEVSAVTYVLPQSAGEASSSAETVVDLVHVSDADAEQPEPGFFGFAVPAECLDAPPTRSSGPPPDDAVPDDGDDGDDGDTPIGRDAGYPPDDYEAQVVNPIDPNDMLGPEGFGAERWVSASSTLPYTIRFENRASATAPAQQVTITHTLDPDLDARTFRFGDFGWGDVVVDVDEATSAFIETRVDLTATKGFHVDVFAFMDLATRTATWTLTTIDPATGDLPVDALAGFLPPDNPDGVGDGFVNFGVKADRLATTGARLDARARIVFDTEEPIDTPDIMNTIDAVAPESAVSALAESTDQSTFLVSWTGLDDDGGSAIAAYDIRVSIDGGAFGLWRAGVTGNSAIYTGDYGRTYAFQSIAIDNAGNRERPPAGADATIRVVGTASIAGVKFHDRDGDGVRTAGEEGLAGWTIFLDADADGVRDADELATSTDADGRYRLEALGPGSYRVAEEMRDGWAQTAPAGGVHVVVLATGEVVEGRDFGNRLVVGSLAGVKFEDVDGDGQRDADEQGLAGWTIFLDADEDGLLDAGERSVVTDATGAYAFSNLMPGRYVVAEVQQTGWTQTTPAVDPAVAGAALLTTTASGIAIQVEGCACGTAWSSSGITTVDSAVGGSGGNTVITTMDLGAQSMANALAVTGITAARDSGRFGALDGRGVRTVVIDTGIDLDHAFFGVDANQDGRADRIVYSYDFANGDADASDRSGHGSHVASLIGGEDDEWGGIASATDLIALKVFEDGGAGSFAYLERALQWVVANARAYDVGVVNLSLGDGGVWQHEASRYGLGDEFAALAALDIVVVSAAGNGYYPSNALGVAYPGADPAVIAVGATWTGDFGGPWTVAGGATDYETGLDHVAAFSQRDSDTVNVFAPGARFNGASATGGVRTMQGTSQASAFVSGAAALAQQYAKATLGRQISTGEFASLLATTSDTIVDGDDEVDNVRNSGLSVPRLNLQRLLLAIDGLPVDSPRNGGASSGGDDDGSGGAPTPLQIAAPGVHVVQLVMGATVTGLDFGNRNPAPEARDDAFVLDMDGTLEIDIADLLENDVDAFGDIVVFAGAGEPSHGVSVLTSDGAALRYAPAAGFHGVDTFVYTVRDAHGGVGSATVTLDVRRPPLRVTSVVPLPSGVAVRFDRPFDAAAIGLHGGAGLADVQLVHETLGRVGGSLVIDNDAQGFTFVRTGTPLPAGSYQLTLHAGTGGFADLLGIALDGDRDGAPGGDFTTSFSVVRASEVVVALADIVRGPGQAVGAPAGAGSAAGLPVHLSDAAGVRRFVADIRFDPSLLAVDGIRLASGISGTVSRTGSAGVVHVDVLLDTALPAGARTLLYVDARVPSTAIYGALGRIDITEVVLERDDGSSIDVIADGAVQVVGYLGDADGDGRYSRADADALMQLVTGRALGLEAWRNAAPILLGDIHANGQFTSLDVSRLVQHVNGVPRPEIPSIPVVAPPTPPVMRLATADDGSGQAAQIGMMAGAEIAASSTGWGRLVQPRQSGAENVGAGERTADDGQWRRTLWARDLAQRLQQLPAAKFTSMAAQANRILGSR